MSTINPCKRVSQLVVLLLFLVTSSLAFAGDEPGYLGVYLQDLDSSMAKALQLDTDSGVLVSDIVEDSPAEDSGIQDGDVILVFDGKKIGSSKALTKSIQKTGSGENVKILVLRDGKEKSIKVELGEREESDMVWNSFDHKKLGKMKSHRWVGKSDNHIEIIGEGDLEKLMLKKNGFIFGGDRGVMGVHIDDLSEQMGDYFGVKDGEGVLITEIVDDSPAQEAGLKAGDVIVKLDGNSVVSTAELHEALSGTEAEQKMEIGVIRKGKNKEFKITLGEASEQTFIQNIEFFDDKHSGVRTPRMKMHHKIKHPKQFHDDNLDDLRQELKNLKKELKSIQKELDK